MSGLFLIARFLSEGPVLPQSRDDEFRPFERKLPEFKFWWSFVRATVVAFVAAFFPVFDVSVVGGHGREGFFADIPLSRFRFIGQSF